LVYFELENRTWRQHFGLFIDGQYKCRKKKTAVLARSAGSSMQKGAEHRSSSIQALGTVDWCW